VDNTYISFRAQHYCIYCFGIRSLAGQIKSLRVSCALVVLALVQTKRDLIIIMSVTGTQPHRALSRPRSRIALRVDPESSQNVEIKDIQPWTGIFNNYEEHLSATSRVSRQGPRIKKYGPLVNRRITLRTTYLSE
jgi:hypothetical protein